MTVRTKIVFIYCIVAVLSFGLCWSIYWSALKINDAFSTFTNEELLTLGHLFSVRANLNDHERQLYEYYATTNRTQALVRLALVRRTLEKDLAFLQTTFNSDAHYQTLERTYAGFSEEFERLDAILKTPPIDWNAARAALSRLSEYSRAAAPALNQLFQIVSTRSEQSQAQVSERLQQITRLVIGFVIVALAIALVIGYITREMLWADADRRRLAYFPERSPSPVFSLTLDGEIKYANPSSHRLAARIDENLPSVLPPDIKQRIQMLRAADRQWQYYEYKLNEHVFSAMLQLLPDLDVCHVYVTDVTDQRKAQENLRFLAYHDPVTGLPNLQSFLNDCKDWSDTKDFAFSVSMIAFLRFELISRSLGLDVVDELLKLLGQRLSNVLATAGAKIHTACLYRLSGASFALLLRAQRDIDLPAVTEQVADSFSLEASQPLQVRRREFCLRPAIGACFCPDDAILPDVLIGNARAALASLVADCRSGYQTLTPEIIGAEGTWLETETALRHGLESGEFCLHYQAKVAATDNRVCGLEALIRWDRKHHGLVSPINFIPVAEESGLILPLGAWVLDEACRQAAAWISSRQDDGFTVAVNVSALQFQQTEFVTHVEQALNRHGLDSHSLELEITETLLMQDLERNIATLKALRELGVGLALDDFGTGYSSLEYLHRFPVTQIKIDRAFVIHITDDPRECAIVRAMIDLAHHLDLKIIAEGIETKEQADLLASLGCDELQGYYFCRPLPPADMLTWWCDQDSSPNSPVKAIT